jgi:hypothetical protein
MYLAKPLLLLLICGTVSGAQTLSGHDQNPGRASNAAQGAGTSVSSTTTDSTPPGMVAFFMTQTCPAGWVIPEKVPGRLIVGVTDGAAVGTTVNNPMLSMTVPAHEHKFKTTVTLERKNIALVNGGNRQGARHGNYSVEGTTESSAKNPSFMNLPFIQLTICQKQ